MNQSLKMEENKNRYYHKIFSIFKVRTFVLYEQ